MQQSPLVLGLILHRLRELSIVKDTQIRSEFGFVEDLNVRGLVKNHKLAKSITDASWYQFRQWLEYFGSKFGREVIAVPPHYTSQECSNCGVRTQKSLSTRTHFCPHCGYTEQRDINAAKVILSRAPARGWHSQSNASGDVSSTPVGSNTCCSKKRR